jgi:hypothetical protein
MQIKTIGLYALLLVPITSGCGGNPGTVTRSDAGVVLPPTAQPDKTVWFCAQGSVKAELRRTRNPATEMPPVAADIAACVKYFSKETITCAPTADSSDFECWMGDPTSRKVSIYRAIRDVRSESS